MIRTIFQVQIKSVKSTRVKLYLARILVFLSVSTIESGKEPRIVLNQNFYSDGRESSILKLIEISESWKCVKTQNRLSRIFLFFFFIDYSIGQTWSESVNKSGASGFIERDCCKRRLILSAIGQPWGRLRAEWKEMMPDCLRRDWPPK